VENDLKGANIVILLLWAIAGCESCPPSMPVTLGNGEVVTADANSGAESQADSTWAFYADTGLGPLGFLGTVISDVPGFLFRVQFGEQGQLIRVFDNQILAPQILGDELILDNVSRPTLDPALAFAGESYAAEDGAAGGLVSCGIIYLGPFSAVKAQVEYSGTLNTLLGTSNGQLRFISEVNPIFGSLMSPPATSETVEIAGYAIKEGSILPGL
jgi:hypothetical protein